MSGKVFSRVRGGGFFKRADIIVYALISFVGFAAGRGMRLLIRREQSRISEQ